MWFILADSIVDEARHSLLQSCWLEKQEKAVDWSRVTITCKSQSNRFRQGRPLCRYRPSFFILLPVSTLLALLSDQSSHLTFSHPIWIHFVPIYLMLIHPSVQLDFLVIFASNTRCNSWIYQIAPDISPSWLVSATILFTLPLSGFHFNLLSKMLICLPFLSSPQLKLLV